MSLTSLSYFGFLLLVVLLYYVLPRRTNVYLLLAASVAFYCFAMPGQLLILMAYLWIIYALGLMMKRKKGRKLPLILGILLSVGYLFTFKYLNFTLSIFNGQEKTLSIVTPIGISYVTFQCISYLADLKNGKCPIVKNPIYFFTYALFFPKITAGPIEAPGHFFAELKNRPSFSWNSCMTGLVLITTGLVKKLVIADLLAPGVAAVFDGNGTDGLSTLLGVIMYTLQIYFDFSGYTDIARGSGYLFGLHLTENFKNPYGATSVGEFWRRWHISLSEWLKKYIYIPLGGSRVGKVRHYLNILITFLVSGIWHGAAWTFILWGLLHGIYQFFEILLRPVGVKLRETLHIAEEGGFHRAIARIRTFILVAFAWIFFRADSLTSAGSVIRRIFTGWNSPGEVLTTLNLDVRLLILMIGSGGLVGLVRHFLKEEKEKQTWAVILTGVSMLILVLLSILFAPEGTTSSFIYFNF